MATTATQRSNDFARLIRVREEFELLVNQSNKLHELIQSSRRYIANAGSNSRLGAAYLDMLIPQYRTTLAQLNRKRHEALELLIGTDRPQANAVA